ncbi:hypothetical protein E3N88_11742 [Mikania micrantha]|uniref:Uncharacterized protein n=1 Tax=Mikania micrantha TaxID=192012 RepID=A0A5N6P5K1_9ASTR|nr:hypothetical protein E3N88_11742 [Mikania micrantha]
MMGTNASTKEDLHGTKEMTGEAKEAEGFTSDLQASTARGRRQDIHRRLGWDILEKGMAESCIRKEEPEKKTHIKYTITYSKEGH